MIRTEALIRSKLNGWERDNSWPPEIIIGWQKIARSNDAGRLSRFGQAKSSATRSAKD